LVSYLRKILNVISIPRYIELLTFRSGPDSPVLKDNTVKTRSGKTSGLNAVLIHDYNSAPPFHYLFISEAKISLANI